MKNFQAVRREIMAKEIAEIKLDRLDKTELARLAERQIVEDLLQLDNTELEERHADYTTA